VEAVDEDPAVLNEAMVSEAIAVQAWRRMRSVVGEARRWTRREGRLSGRREGSRGRGGVEVDVVDVRGGVEADLVRRSVVGEATAVQAWRRAVEERARGWQVNDSSQG
jgi:hypothetical protein